MKRGAHRHVLALLALSAVCSSCQNEPPMRVVFAESKPIGSWYTDDNTSSGGSPAPRDDKPSDGESTGDDQGQALDPDMASTPTPNRDDGSVGGAGGADAHPADGAGGQMAAAGGSPAATTPANPIMVSFAFTTKVVHLGKLDKNGTCVVPNPTPMLPKSCWGPENAGAVWVETASGQFVKTLEVWAKSRRQNLVKYAAAHGDMPIDVTAMASRVKDLTTGDVPNDPHTDVWTGVDRSGKVVPAGKYQIEVELADCDAADDPTCKNALLEVPFDSAMHGPMAVTDMPFFINIKLSVE